MDPINILITDDHEIVREGLIMILKNREDIGTVFQASNGEETLLLCSTNDEIDLVLLDLNLPDMNGVEVAEQIKEHYPDKEIIILSMMKDEESIRKALKAGASGFVLKDAGKADLLQAIENFKQGKPFYSEEVTFKFMKDYGEGENYSSKAKEPVSLTDREIEILRLIANEFTNRQIAEKLHISKRTVDTHRTNLLQKTNSKNTAGLVRYALKNDLL